MKTKEEYFQQIERVFGFDDGAAGDEERNLIESILREVWQSATKAQAFKDNLRYHNSHWGVEEPVADMPLAPFPGDHP